MSDLRVLTILFFALRCPKTVENFCVHSRNGYYNSHIFHRVIKVWCTRIQMFNGKRVMMMMMIIVTVVCRVS